MSYTTRVELVTPSYGGANTATQFSLLPPEQSPRMQNAYMEEIGDLSQRPGTIPLTTSALAAPIRHMALYKPTPTNVSADIVGASGTTLYKYNGTTAWAAQTMTNALNTSDIYTCDFTNSGLVHILFITDGATMKKYDGTAVANIPGAANDPSPEPPNGIVAINAKNPKFCWTYTNHVFVSPGNNEIYYSKRYEFDYFPTVQYYQLVRENDFVNGCGLAYNNSCLIPMRRGWAVLIGEGYDDFVTPKYLNTTSGVIAPRTIAKVNYPNGLQTIAYLSDDGVHEVYDTGITDDGTRQYATRSLMKEKIDFDAIGLTEAEKSAAIGYFDQSFSLYFLSFLRDGVNFTYVFDTRNQEWYTDWLTFNSQTYIRNNLTLYFAGVTGHLHKFDKDLDGDYSVSDASAGVPVHFKRYSPARSFEFSGFPSFWDAYLLESKQWLKTASLDITFIFSNKTELMQEVVKNEIFVEGVSEWKVAQYINPNFTDYLNEAPEILFEWSRLSKYAQVLIENNRFEPVKLFKDKFKGRVSGR